MPLFIGGLDAGGDQPSVPGTPTAVTGQNALSEVTFTPSSYIGKDLVEYQVISTPGNITVTGVSPVVVTGLTNGVTYTFKVRAVTNYGVSSELSAASNSVIPVLPPPPPPPGPPPPPPPGPPPPPPPACPAAGTLLGSGCTGTTLYYAYADGNCGVGSTVIIEYNSPTCGYVPPPPATPGCTECVYTVTGQSQYVCGCFEVPGGLRQRYGIITTYSFRCNPDPCTGCSCPTSSDSGCIYSFPNCLE